MLDTNTSLEGPVLPATPVTGCWSADQLHHAWWVIPGAFLAGEYPAGKTAAVTDAKIKLLLDAGVTSFIDLTTPADRLAPYAEALAQRNGAVRYVSFPIPDMGIVEPHRYDAIVGYIRQELLAGHVVYVHCWGGMGRTTTVVGAFLIDTLGLNYRSTVRRIAQLRAGTRKARVACPQSAAQHKVLRGRSAARLGVTSPSPSRAATGE